jgi:exopolyphosphatase / guanosine-5'-triphosphate,3'-diphosphate pyrophosphatase
MRVAVIDVGSNTVRLLVGEAGPNGLACLRQRRERVGLGADVETSGRITSAKLKEAAACARVFASEARSLGCSRVEVIATSPGRQAENAGRLVRALAAAAKAPVQILSPEEEAELAYDGALAWAGPRPGSVAVCDVGGGSTQVAVGTSQGAVWIRSVDIGSLRLTARLLDADPPGKKAIMAAQADLREEFDGFSPPLPQSAFAVGGSARALAKLVGHTLGEEELSLAVRALRKQPAAQIAKAFGIDRCRVSTLTGGALILAEVQRRLAVSLGVAGAGLREGCALSLLAEATAA